MESIEGFLRWTGGLAMLGVLVTVLYGLWRGLHQPIGRASGRGHSLLHSTAFYVLMSLGYFGVCALLWRPIPLSLPVGLRNLMMAFGALLLFSGLALVLWGRLSLGKWYFGSTTMGAELFAGHQLVKSGPYALVRHPMYVGYILTGVGGLLLYRNWTMVFLTITFLTLIRRAWQEEQALSAEFGEAWQAYCRDVPRWIPRLWRG